MPKNPFWLRWVELGVLFLFLVAPLQFVFGGSNLFIKVAKDVLFFAPAYIILTYRGGLFAWAVKNPILICTLLPFAILVAAKAVLGVLVDPVTVFIGLKCWLFYYPLLYIGYLARSFWLADNGRSVWFVRLISRLFLIGNISIVVQAFLVAVGLESYAYLLYGDMAKSITQEFAITGDADFSVVRNPGIYIFTLQACGFVLASIFMHYGLRLIMPRCLPSYEQIGGLIVAILAGVLLGARTLLILIPLIVLCCELIADRKFGSRLAFLGMLFLCFSLGFGMLLSFRSASLDSMIIHLREVLSYYFVESSEYNVLRQAATAGADLPFGNGIGTATGPARFALGDVNDGPRVVGVESYLGKARVEMGLVAPWLLGLSWVGILVGLVHKGRRGGRLASKEASLAIVALISVVGLSIKGSSLDYDPLNVLFWLGIGFVLGDDRGFEGRVGFGRGSKMFTRR